MRDEVISAPYIEDRRQNWEQSRSHEPFSYSYGILMSFSWVQPLLSPLLFDLEVLQGTELKIDLAFLTSAFNIVEVSATGRAKSFALFATERFVRYIHHYLFR